MNVNQFKTQNQTTKTPDFSNTENEKLKRFRNQMGMKLISKQREYVVSRLRNTREN